MRKNKPLKLTDYLSVGEENAITAKQLAKYLGWNERDVEQFVRGMQGRIKDMQRAMKPAIEHLKNGGGDNC